MKTKIGFYIIFLLFSLTGISQTSIIDSFKLSPKYPLITDDIKFLVYYNDVPGSLEPEASIRYSNDSIYMVSTINSAVGCCLENYIDTIEIGRLSLGEYILKHELNDIGKVGFLGTDAVFTFMVNAISYLQINNRNNIIVYPNPTKDKVIFLMNGSIKNDLKISVSNLFGQEISSFNYLINDDIITIDLRNLPYGLYFVNIKDREFQHCQKIIRD